MIPVRLKIEGFLSYRQPVELDFSGFDLACISGQNGAGKSSLLDAITWALFGRARKHDESVINTHPKVEAAEVTLDFDYEGNRYRVQRANPRGKTSSVEFSILLKGEDKDRWKPLTERTLRDTDAKIVETLRMDYDTFTNASFFLQGKADQFAVARPSERKQILSNILGLEIWESYREAAGKQRRRTEKDVRGLDGRLNEIQVELDEGPQRKEHLAELEERLAELEAQRKDRAAALENVQRLGAALEEQRKLLKTLSQQLEGAERNKERLTKTLSQRREEQDQFSMTLEKADEIEQAYADWQAARKELEAMEEVAEQFRQHEALRHAPLAEIQSDAARLEQEKQSLAEQGEALEKAQAEAAGLEESLQEAREAAEAAQAKLDQRQKLEEELRGLQAKQAEAKAENPRLRDEMHELKDRIDQLQVAEGATCPLCGQPLAADERETLIDSLSTEGTELGDRFRENKKLLETFETQLQGMGAQLADLKGVESTLREANRRADRLGHQLETLEEQRKAWEAGGAARLAEIEAALAEEAFAEEAREKLGEIDKELESLGYDLEAHEKLRRTEQAGREAEADLRALEQAKAALGPIEREIAGLEEQLAEQDAALEKLTEAHTDAAAQFAAAEAEQPDITAAEADLHDMQEKENRLRLEVGGARQKVVVLDTLRERKAGLVEEREALTQRIADLKQLEKAFGKDGVPALLIEQALPEIQETANDLLARLSDGRMSFRFETQREYKDSKRDDFRETLDMVIADSLGDRDYEMFSGGEAFRVNFAIRLALSKMLARRAGARLQTLVIDEGFGSQDALGRQRLVEAINLVRDDFEKILVITHLEELKDAFPTRIEVEKTPEGSQLRVV
ncbi:SMC family ATPase [bacterium]|nr:SMC family ATPase [bacterium]